MAENNELIYNGIKICKADFDALNDLDKTKRKLDERRMLAVSTLTDIAFTDKKNLALIEKFIDVTYPESIKTIEEKRTEILEKYDKSRKLSQKTKKLLYNIVFMVIAITVIILAALYIIKTAV